MSNCSQKYWESIGSRCYWTWDLYLISDPSVAGLWSMTVRLMRSIDLLRFLVSVNNWISYSCGLGGVEEESGRWWNSSC